MLRRKLFLHLGGVVMMFVIAAGVALWMLGHVLRDLSLIESLYPNHAEHLHALAMRFRNVVLLLGGAFIVAINLSILVVLRMAGFIVRPVDELVHATHELGQEHFEHRVNIQQHDEFEQLAESVNKLAENLQASEQRKMEVLSQLAVTLNHELNNAMAVIQLQLKRIGRDPNATPENLTRLQEIEQSLQRMTRTVQSLRNIRRIVLTDYIPGMKMLDLEKSVASAEADSSVGAHHTHAL